MFFGPEKLDEFVARSDELRLGTPECEAFWGRCHYVPVVAVDKQLDPFSEAYVAQQIALYSEISGRTLDLPTNEQTEFQPQAHLESATPYGDFGSSELAKHYLRLSYALRKAAPVPKGPVLDMGAGWGLSSEFLAMLGHPVTAVDISPQFALINARCERHGLPVRAVCSTFEEFTPDTPVDLILFYECLHHAVRPWQIVERLGRFLTTEGRMVLCGEPFNETWWPNWGMRLDPVSLYCIRKFGWFESGWSKNFMAQCLTRAGMQHNFFDLPDADLATLCVAYPPSRNALDIEGLAKAGTGWNLDGTMLVSLGTATLTLTGQANFARFSIINHRSKPLQLKLAAGAKVLHEGLLVPGRNSVIVPLDPAASSHDLNFQSDVWCPAEEIGNGDGRSISFHVTGVSLF